MITAAIAGLVNASPMPTLGHGKHDVVSRSTCVAADIALFKSVATHPKYFCKFWLAQYVVNSTRTVFTSS